MLTATEMAPVPVHDIKRGNTMRHFAVIAITALLVFCIGCQQDAVPDSQSRMKGAWTSLGTLNLKEIRHLTYVPGKNALMVAGVPQDEAVGLQYFHLDDKQWTAPPEDTPAKHIFTTGYRAGSSMYAVMFANAENAGQILVTNDEGATWSDPLVLPDSADPRCLALAGEDAGILLLGTVNRGIYLSGDSGNTWTAPEMPPDDPGIQGFAVDSGDAMHVLAATRTGICESRDAGKTWQSITARFSMDPVFVVEVVSHPRKAGTFTCIHRSAAGRATVLRSTDAGETWTPIQNGLYADSQPRCIVFHPTNDTTAYMGTVYDGVYKTDTMGDTWYPINNGLPVEKPIIIHCLEFVPGNPGALMAGSNLEGQLFELTDY